MANVRFVNFTEKDFLATNKKEIVPPLCKFMQLEYALQMLDGNQMCFLNPTGWEDPLEKRFIVAQYPKNKIDDRKFPWKDRVFCSCFTEAGASEAHWKIHANNGIGVELKIKRDELLKFLRNLPDNIQVFISKVEYRPVSEITTSLSKILPQGLNFSDDEHMARLLSLKRNAYQYEKEIRIMLLFDDKGETKNKVLVPTKVSKCSIKKIIKSIVLSPFLKEKERDLLRECLQDKYDLRIERSHLLDKYFDVATLKW